MLYMKEMRPVVQAECTLKESAAINQILGRRVRNVHFSFTSVHIIQFREGQVWDFKGFDSTLFSHMIKTGTKSKKVGNRKNYSHFCYISFKSCILGGLSFVDFQLFY